MSADQNSVFRVGGGVLLAGSSRLGLHTGSDMRDYGGYRRIIKHYCAGDLIVGTKRRYVLAKSNRHNRVNALIHQRDIIVDTLVPHEVLGD
jgi:hypothetical protein